MAPIGPGNEACPTKDADRYNGGQTDSFSTDIERSCAMPSPFPGMNPYLEQSDTWEDFHTNFITRAQEALSGQFGPNYLVKVEARLILHELSAEERRYLGKADVGVSRISEGNSGAPAVSER
jgi:hypothetical protein